MSKSVTFIRLPLHLDRLWKLAGERNWLARGTGSSDEGLALHHALSEVFGPGTLKPFRLMVPPRQKNGFVYAYSQQNRDEILENAALCGPEYNALFELDALEHKPMKTDFPAGRRLGFEIHLRPVRRARRQGPQSPPGEMDVFLHEALHRFPEDRADEDSTTRTESRMREAGRSREAVYRDWLAERLRSAAELCSEQPARLVHFRRRPVLRNGKVTEGPDATLQGELKVTDTEAFSRLVAGGIGRHKAYGYGMLLLRPPSTGRE